MNSILPTERASEALKGLQLLVFYTDFPAAIMAKQLTDQMTILAGNDWRTSLQFWKLDSIPTIGPLKEIIAKDASAADALIIATSSPKRDDPVISYWLDLLSATNPRRLAHGLLVGVCGNEKTNAIEMDWMLSSMFLFACRAQLDFVWQKPGIKTTNFPAWIADPFNALLDRKARVSKHAADSSSHQRQHFTLQASGKQMRIRSGLLNSDSAN